MTIDAAYEQIKFLARKNQTGSITPKEFAISFNSAQKDLFNSLLGKITVAPHVALGNNIRVTERLLPFKITEEDAAVNGQIAAFPAGFQAITEMYDDATGNAVRYIDDAKLRGRLKSAIDPIAEANPPVYTVTSEGWKVWPNSIVLVKVSYYKLPPAVKWGYTDNDNGRPVYDPNKSVDPLWDDVSCEDILAKCCTYLGISFEKQSLVNFGETQKAQGL